MTPASSTEPTTVEHNRKRFAWNMAGQLSAAIVCGVLMIADVDVGVPLGLLFASSGVRSLVRFRDRNATLAIDAAGVTDNSSYLPGGLLRWEEISTVDEWHLGNDPALLIRLPNPETYLKRVAVWKRPLLRSNIGIVGTPAILTQSSLAVPLAEVKRQIEQGKREWERQQNMLPQTRNTNTAAPIPATRHWWTAVSTEERAPLRVERKG